MRHPRAVETTGNKSDCRVANPLGRVILKSLHTRLFWLVFCLLVIAAVGASTAYGQEKHTSQSPTNIACLGHIEPKDGVASISARSLSGQPSIIKELKVKEGDWVKTGQTLAVLDSRDQLQAVVKDSEEKVAVAQNRLALIQAGARSGDIAAQEAEVARLEAQLTASQAEFKRYDALYQTQALTASEHDQRALAVANADQMLKQAKFRLASLKEVRNVDIRVAEAEAGAAKAAVALAKAESAASIVRAPFDGRILKVHAHLGEEVGTNGILELAKTDQMYVIAEVFESDVSRLGKDQKATITGDALSKPLQGRLESIGDEIAKNGASNLDPVSLSDARVIEVKIKLDDSSTASHLVHAKVTVIIHP